MAYYLFASEGQQDTIAPSLGGGTEPGNPTIIPLDLLRKFQFTFLIRHPRRSIPSYWRCTIPPLVDITGFNDFLPEEAGYAELIRLFDYLVEMGIVDKDQITVIDADDMLDRPESIIRQYCLRTGIDFRPEMLEWNEDDKKFAAQLFAKWNGFHDDALGTSGLEARTHAQVSNSSAKCRLRLQANIVFSPCPRRLQQLIPRTPSGSKSMVSRHKRLYVIRWTQTSLTTNI